MSTNDTDVLFPVLGAGRDFFLPFDNSACSGAAAIQTYCTRKEEIRDKYLASFALRDFFRYTNQKVEKNRTDARESRNNDESISEQTLTMTYEKFFPTEGSSKLFTM